MQKYLDSLRYIMDRGIPTQTGAVVDGRKVTTRAVFALHYRHDLERDGFPAVTTKPLVLDSMVKELLWFLRGETNKNTLGCNIWNGWARPDGDCGPIYGQQWRRWEYPRPGGADDCLLQIDVYDQIGQLIADLRKLVNDPTDRCRRRMLVSAWNPPDILKMGLPPCHTMFQVDTTDGRINLMCHWRSIDMFFGFPFNISSYALLMHLLAEVTGLPAGELVANIGNAHIYDNQFVSVNEQLTRTPLPPPKLIISPSVKSLAPDLSVEQCRLLNPSLFSLEGYNHCGPLSTDRPKVAV